MDNHDSSDLDFPDFSEIIAEIQEYQRRVFDMMQQLRETLFPIIQVISQNVQNLSAVLIEALRPLQIIAKLGNNQFVFWLPLPEDLANRIEKAEDVDHVLREWFIEEDQYKIINETIENCVASPSLKGHIHLFQQSVAAFKLGSFDLAATGFTSVIDGLLADLSGLDTHKLSPRINAIMEKLEKDELLDSSEYAILTLGFTFKKTIESFSKTAPFSEPEPKLLNRHWIAHGRSTHPKTDLDCIKLIHLIYGMLLIDELGKSEVKN